MPLLGFAGAINYLYETDPDVRNRTNIIHGRVFNSFAAHRGWVICVKHVFQSIVKNNGKARVASQAHPGPLVSSSAASFQQFQQAVQFRQAVQILLCIVLIARETAIQPLVHETASVVR
eukprot:582040-Pelagomonas_calceolata.AAC.1